jgi:hypothetical protein
MSLTRFVAVGILSCAGYVFAQVPSISMFPAPPASDVTTGDQASTILYPLFDVDRVLKSAPQNEQWEDQAKTQINSREDLLNLFDAERNRPRFIPRAQLQNDATCFAIRSYRMVRDDPQSDSTHRDGYTTCVPAARFRVYTTDEKR